MLISDGFCEDWSCPILLELLPSEVAVGQRNSEELAIACEDNIRMRLVAHRKRTVISLMTVIDNAGRNSVATRGKGDRRQVTSISKA